VPETAAVQHEQEPLAAAAASTAWSAGSPAGSSIDHDQRGQRQDMFEGLESCVESGGRQSVL